MTTAAGPDLEPERYELAAALAAARDRAGVVATIWAAAGIAWWGTVERVTGMEAGPGTVSFAARGATDGPGRSRWARAAASGALVPPGA
jgi:hypothetical protein